MHQINEAEATSNIKKLGENIYMKKVMIGLKLRQNIYMKRFEMLSFTVKRKTFRYMQFISLLYLRGSV